MDFSERLRALRNKENLTVTQLANIVNKSEGAVRMWETGRSFPGIDTLVELSRYFNCTTDYLLGVSNVQNKDEAKKVLKFERELQEKYAYLTPKLKAEFANIADNIVLLMAYAQSANIDIDDALFPFYRSIVNRMTLYFLEYNIRQNPKFDEIDYEDTREEFALLFRSFKNDMNIFIEKLYPPRLVENVLPDNKKYDGVKQTILSMVFKNLDNDNAEET